MVEKIDVWGATGDVTEPSSVKRDSGWVAAEQPRHDWFNWVDNAQSNKINEILDEGFNMHYPAAADVKSMLMTGLWDESWGITEDTLNIIDSGATPAFADMGVWFNSDDEPNIVILDATLNKIEVWDARARTLSDTSPDLATTDYLPAGTYIASSMAIDAANAYVIFRETTANPDEYFIQAYDIASWDIVSGWPAAGTQLSGAADTKNGKVINASSTKLAVACDWVTISSSASTAISIIDKADGSISTEGAGDAPTGVSAVADPKIASDGTNIFFGVYGTGQGYICSATIADATSGCGGTGYPLTWPTAASYCNSLTSCGPSMFVSGWRKGTPLVGDIVLGSHTAANVGGDRIKRGINSQAIDGDEYICDGIYDAVFDGINIWLFTVIDNLASGASMALIKIDAAKFSGIVGTSRDLSDITDSVFMMNPGSAAGNYPTSGLTFDGRDVWFLRERAANLPNSGTIRRLPFARFRS